MLWEKLFNRIGKLPLATVKNTHIYAILENPQTHVMEHVYLELKYNKDKIPYFVKCDKPAKNFG